MYFDFDDRYSDIEPVGKAINLRDGVALSVVVHVVAILAAFLAPTLLPVRSAPTAIVQPPQEKDAPTFVFVQPRVDKPAPAPPKRAETSDLDRMARAPERPPEMTNPLPFNRGNSRERAETTPDERMRGKGPSPEPAPEAPPAVEAPAPTGAPQRDAQLALLQRPQQQPQSRPPGGGTLGDALRNLQRYVQDQSFDNPKGNVQDFGPLQFDTKGVEFGPWIRRFVSQVRRNWFVPYAAMSMRGRVVITFNVHRNGALTDVTVVRPSEIESFNTAAVNALLASNPTTPLPPEYPDDKAFFTVTFYYNESPQ